MMFSLPHQRLRINSAAFAQRAVPEQYSQDRSARVSQWQLLPRQAENAASPRIQASIGLAQNSPA
jgi:hypothetical protein